MKPTHRTMWMIPRNIRKIEPWKLVQIANLIYGEKFAFEVCHTLKQTFQLTKFQDQASVEVL